LTESADRDEIAQNTADVAVVQRVLDGQIQEFAILLDQYQGFVFSIVSKYLPHDQVAELAHEIFVEAFRSLSSYDENKIFKKWLAGIASHKCYDYLRQLYRNQESPLSTLTDDHQNWLDTIVSPLSADHYLKLEQQKEAHEILQMVMSILPAKDKMVVTLVYLEGHTIREAAEILGWSRISVKVRAYRAREKMRKTIKTMIAGGWQR